MRLVNGLREKAKELKAELALDHPLVVMVAEHDQILLFLKELEELNGKFQSYTDIQGHQQELAELKRMAENLLSAENHHKREEEALFPKLERIGISGPPMVMRMEHDELRKNKRALLDLANQAETMDGQSFKSRLSELVPIIVSVMRDHIEKENTILYPAALQHIADPAEWDEIKADADKIGYCPFTPDDGK